jgi:membrane protein
MVGAAASSIAAYDASNAPLDRTVTEPLAAERWIGAVQAWPWQTTAQMLLRRFREDRLALTAGSLTFTTIISLVPLITVMLALLSAFPMFAALQDSLQRYFLQTLVPDAIARPVMGAITQFSLRASRLGMVGRIALFVSALAMMLTIDRALNAIWRVRTPRRIAQRVLVYWAAVTLGPLVFAVSLTATSYAVSVSRGLVGGMPRGLGLAVATIEFLVEGLGVAALFRYVPNTHVRWRHALLGGAFVATCMVAGKRALTAYFGAVPTYAMIYGAFATLPIFLVWIYLSWVIVLLGAVIAAYAPLLGKGLTRWPEGPGSDFRLALVVVDQLARARDQGRRGCEADVVAAAIGIDPLQIGPVLDVLVELDWVGRLDEAKGGGRYVLLCDPATTPAEPLIARLLLDPAPDLEAAWQRAGFHSLRLGELLPGITARADRT